MSELSPETYRAALEALPTGVYLVDRDRRILLWSKGAEQLTGYLAHEVVGRSYRDDVLMPCDENGALICGQACHLQQALQEGSARGAALYLRHKSGRRVAVSIHAVPLRDESGRIVGAIECFERRAVFLAADPAAGEAGESPGEPAGLPDRAATETLLDEYLRAHLASGFACGAVSVAVDALEQVRRTKGREAVGAILNAVGQTLAGALGPDDLIGRWSDEQFLVVVTNCTPAGLSRAGSRMKRLVGSVEVPWWGDRIPITVSVGSAMAQAGDDPRALAGRAERALESARLENAVAV